MKKIIFTFFLLFLTLFLFSQKETSTAENIKEPSKKLHDGSMQSFNFISMADAEKILEKPAHLIDSAYKVSSSVSMYRFDYVADYKDSTSKGKKFFDFEQYKNDTISKDIYQTIKIENEKIGTVISLNDIGASESSDNSIKPFLLISYSLKVLRTDERINFSIGCS